MSSLYAEEIHNAAKTGNIPLLVELIAEKADVDARDKSNQPPLCTAIANWQNEAVKILVDSKANVNIALPDQEHTIFTVALCRGNFPAMCVLLDTNAALEITDSHLSTALICAAQKLHHETIVKLLDAKANIDTEGCLSMIRHHSGINHLGETLLKGDEQQRHSRTLELASAAQTVLRANITNPKLARAVNDVVSKRGSLEWRTRYGHTLLMEAVRTNNETAAKILVDAKASVLVRDPEDRTLLARVIEKHQEGLIKILGDAVDADGMTAVGSSVQFGDIYTLKQLINAKASLDVKNNLGQTPLMLAAIAGRTEVVQMLLEAGVQLEETDKQGNTALLCAVANGRIDIMRRLYDAKASVLVQDTNKRTPLELAVAKGYYAAVEFLLDVHPDSGYDMVCEAARRMSVDTLSKLKAVDISMNIANARCEPALVSLAASGLADAVRVLLDANASVDVCDSYGITALMRAAVGGHTRVARVLLDANADLTLKNKDGQTAFQLVERTPHEDTTELLVAATVIRNFDMSRDGVHGSLWNLLCLRGSLEWKTRAGVTPLVEAAMAGNTDAVRALLAAKASLNAEGVDGANVLHSAVLHGHAGVMKELLDAKAPLEDVRGGMNALQYAASKGQVDAINVLLDAKATVDARDAHEMTPLMLAASGGHAAAAKTLLSAKASITERDGGDKTAVSHALENMDAETIQVLLDAVAVAEKAASLAAKAVALGAL